MDQTFESAHSELLLLPAQASPDQLEQVVHGTGGGQEAAVPPKTPQEVHTKLAQDLAALRAEQAELKDAFHAGKQLLLQPGRELAAEASLLEAAIDAMTAREDHEPDYRAARDYLEQQAAHLTLNASRLNDGIGRRMNEREIA